jgi:hypothetical protein
MNHHRRETSTEDRYRDDLDRGRRAAEEDPAELADEQLCECTHPDGVHRIDGPCTALGLVAGRCWCRDFTPGGAS